MYQTSIQTSPHLSIEQKLNGKRSAYNKKFGSPKLRDMLREVSFISQYNFYSETITNCFFLNQKCRLRIKESRCDAFDGGRTITDSNRVCFFNSKFCFFLNKS